MLDSDIVREFYSSLGVTQAADVLVRGTVVPFTVMAINSFFLITRVS